MKSLPLIDVFLCSLNDFVKLAARRVAIGSDLLPKSDIINIMESDYISVYNDIQQHPDNVPKIASKVKFFGLFGSFDLSG